MRLPPALKALLAQLAGCLLAWLAPGAALHGVLPGLAHLDGLSTALQHLVGGAWLGEGLGSAGNYTNEVYDKVNNISKVTTPDCDKIDTAINNRKSIASFMLVGIIVAVISLYMFSSYYGTPVWLKNVISPTSQYVSRGVTLISTGKSYYSLPLLYGSLFLCIILLVRFY